MIQRVNKYIANPTLVEHLDLLAGSLALDEQFREHFKRNRLTAINWYNTEFAPRFRQRQILLTDSEQKLVNALTAKSIDEFIELIAVITMAGH